MCEGKIIQVGMWTGIFLNDMVYKALNAEEPIYLAEQFTRVSDMTSRTLRSSNLSQRPPRVKSRNGQNCFAYRGSSVWNSLPSEKNLLGLLGHSREKAMLEEKY